MLAGGTVESNDLQVLSNCVASAEFDPRAEKLADHVARRVREGQWRPDLSENEYRGHLRAAAVDSTSRLAVGLARGGRLVYVVADTKRIVPAERLGPGAEALLLVVYSVDRDTIITGYMISSLDSVRIPAEAVWLPSLEPPPNPGQTPT